jgi:hypothetical protein
MKSNYLNMHLMFVGIWQFRCSAIPISVYPTAGGSSIDTPYVHEMPLTKIAYNQSEGCAKFRSGPSLGIELIFTCDYLARFTL